MHIDRCNICGGMLERKLALPFESIIGMADSYTQDVGICKKCGFIVTQNPFGSDKLNNRYKNNSKFEFDDASYDISFSDRDGYVLRSRRQKQFIKRVLGGGLRSLIEIGAASGYNLSLYDCDVYGVEPSAINCQNARMNYKIDMFCGTSDEYFAEPGHDNKRYDMVFLSHTLEHIVNPSDFIAQWAAVNDRYFFIEVPTFDYKFIEEPYGMFAEEHVNMFTLESLQNLMAKHGYGLKAANMIMGVQENIPAGWPAISTIWEKCAHPRIKMPVQTSEEMLDRYIAASKQGLADVGRRIARIPDEARLAVWGTGHHASMLLANTALRDKNIVRVYDSDARKTGQLFHGVSIQPFCEEDVYDGKIDAILIATYTAQQSIEKVAQAYDSKVRIITLYEF